MKTKFVGANKWGELIDKIRKMEFDQSSKAEQFEQKRKENIKQRYVILKEAVATGYAIDQTLQYIAELGIEFESGKAYSYLGGEPFNP